MKGLQSIMKILVQLKPELVEKFHVSSIGIFGSAVRDDFRPGSDVDIIVDFNKQVGVEFIDLANYIESKLKKPVDLVSKKGIKDSYFKQIEREIIYV
jgi:uncharacterized protein